MPVSVRVRACVSHTVFADVSAGLAVGAGVPVPHVCVCVRACVVCVCARVFIHLCWSGLRCRCADYLCLCVHRCARLHVCGCVLLPASMWRVLRLRPAPVPRPPAPLCICATRKYLRFTAYNFPPQSLHQMWVLWSPSPWQQENFQQPWFPFVAPALGAGAAAGPGGAVAVERGSWQAPSPTLPRRSRGFLAQVPQATASASRARWQGCCRALEAPVPWLAGWEGLLDSGSPGPEALGQAWWEA